MKRFTYPAENIKLVAASAAPQGAVWVELRPAGAELGLGQVGKNPGEVVLSRREDGAGLLLVSLGSAEKVTAESYRAAGGLLAGYLQKNQVTQAGVDLNGWDAAHPAGALTAFCEGLLLGAFRFQRYKSDEKERLAMQVTLVTREPQAIEALVAPVRDLAACVNLARDWAHEPANVINPVTLAERVIELAGDAGLKVTVIDDQALAEMGAGAITAVGKGSQTPARLIILEYPGKGAADEKPVVLVGKALTFDTGGYSIKSSDGVLGMKYDKCGAMAVVGALVAAAKLGLKTPLVGILAAAENMISGGAYRPDDILITLSGKTVEITSTDAEGRLVLADSLTYAQRSFRPRALIDLATLTGGVVVALGHVRAGLMGNDDGLASALFAAGEATYERLWRLPLDEAYQAQIKGDDGDIKNTGGRPASSIIGGTFLKEFVDDSVPWAHIDIAGTATTEKDLPYAHKGATGFGVRLLVEYLKTLEA